MPDMKRVGVLLVALAMTGCSGGGSTPPEASTTASSAAPSLSKSVSPSEDPLYLEAVEVYKKLMAEERKLMLAGGADALPASMTGLLEEPALTDLTDTYRELKVDGVRIAPTPQAVMRLSPNPGVRRAESIISIRVCEDGRQVPLLHEGKEISKGALINREVFFDRTTDGSLRVQSLEASEGTQCD